MEGDNKKTIKYLMNQPATVHSYRKLNKSESPRTHSSPTSILRKFPHSLRHDQKHQTKIKRNSSPVSVLISGLSISKENWEASRKSWSFGDDGSDESEERPSSDDCVRCLGGGENPREARKSSDASISSDGSTESDVWKPQRGTINTKSVQECEKTSTERGPAEREQNDKLVGPIRKLSVINNSLECKKVSGEAGEHRGDSVNKVSGFGKRIHFPIHKSTPNLLRYSISNHEHMADRSSDEGDSVEGKARLGGGHVSSPNVCHVSLRGSDSLPHLDQRHRIIHSILPRISRTISETAETMSGLRRSNLARAYMKSESHINSQNYYRNAIRHREPYFSLSNILETGGKSDFGRPGDENEELSLIGKHGSVVMRSPKDRKEAKNRWSYRRTVDLVPNLRNLIRRRQGDRGSGDEVLHPAGMSAPLTGSLFPRSDSCSSLNIPQIRYLNVREGEGAVKKCDTVYALTSLIRTDSTFHVEPMKPVNRLRVPPNGFSGSTSRMCSRCSSLLSMASSSKYSINTTGSGFVNCSSSAETPPEPNILCKLCLMEVPVSMSLKIDFCECVFCKDCMRLYVEFEIQEGAYDISCPDAQCNKQGIVSVSEVEGLVMPRMMERYRRFRLNHEVDMDRNRTWCPRAGCETVCNICPREKCAPTSVHCPTCDSDFCSNCKNPWHKGLTCEENSKKLAKEGRADFMEPGIPFDSDSIKCCPMCNVPIEKDEGCAQMMCKRCKHVFCWYCLASLDDDFLLRHYDKGPCKNKLGHTRASVIWHRTQVIGIFAGLGLLLLVASPLLLLAAPCIVCCKCRVCSGTKLDGEDELPEESGT